MVAYKKIKKKIFFRIEISKKIGLGHFVRCWRIAQRLKKKYSSIFVIDKIPQELKKNYIFSNLTIIELYQNNKFRGEKSDSKNFVEKINHNEAKDILFIDDYRLSSKWSKNLKKKFKKIIVIDDLANRKFNCNYYINYKTNFNLNNFSIAKKINKLKTKLILGNQYTILDQSLKKNKHSILKNIIINFGNSLDFGLIKLLIIKILTLNKKTFVCVGTLATNYDYLFSLKKKYKNLKIIQNKIGIGEILSNMDLYIGSAGNSIYENSFLNLVSIFFEMSNNQKNNIDELEKLGHLFFLKKNDLNNKNLILLIKLICQNYKTLRKNFICCKTIKKNGLDNLIKELKI